MCGHTYVEVFYEFVKINTLPNVHCFYDKISSLRYFSSNFLDNIDNIL